MLAEISEVNVYTAIGAALAVVSTGYARAAGQLAPTKNSSSAEVLHPYLVRQLNQMRRLDPLVRADVPDAVHQMRVACRRRRSVFGPNRKTLRLHEDPYPPQGPEVARDRARAPSGCRGAQLAHPDRSRE